MKQLKNKKNIGKLKPFIQDYKKWLPNVLTGMRIVFTPIIIILGIGKQIPLVIAFASIAAVTDFIDGMLARKWNTVSDIGAKLDAVADKIFAIGLCLCLTSVFSLIWGIVFLEIILALFNLYFHLKSGKTESLWVGKIKTTCLFITILCILSYHFIPNIKGVVQGFIYVCVNLQILCIWEYIFNFYDNMHPLSVEDNTRHQMIMEEAMEEKTIELEHLDELITKYEAEKNNE